VNRLVLSRNRENFLRTNSNIFYKIDKDGENETKFIPSNNITDQPGTEAPTSASSLPIADEANYKEDNHTPSLQTDERIQTKKPTKSKGKKNNKNELKSIGSRIQLMHCDIIKDEFWDARPGILCM
jgi:tRNA(His) guanylyltransferase